jgi:hypothetical protein
MAITYQSTPQFFVNSVDLSAWVTAGTANQTFEQLDKTTYSIDYRSFVPGLASNSATITLFLDYASSATYATLQPLVGTQTDIKYILPVLNMTIGELQSIDFRVRRRRINN